MMLKEAEFYQTHLDRVSRSFAFCIRQLPDPLRSWVGLSYLLCRILDTVEDSPWLSKEEQKKAFALFDAALLHADATAKLKDWAGMFSSEINAHERALLNDAEVILQDLHGLPSGVRELVTELVQSMSLGMQHFAAANPPGVLRLKSLSEVNQYCFFVAGLVGELLAKLVARVEPLFPVTQSTVLRAHHFGQFLQKVNLLKDQVADEKSGRYLIPSREEVERSAETNASQAFDFLLSLPSEQIEFRRFCAWSLFLGLEAVSAARASLSAGRIFKVSRDKATEIVGAVEEALADDRRLAQMFTQALEKLGWARAAGPAAVSAVLPEWLLRLYRGRLQPTGLSELGLAIS
jgi:phytoene/squalene synthetase